MTWRAAAISASETRPSDLATCPMHFEGGLEETHADLECIDARTAAARRDTLIVEVTEDDADDCAGMRSSR